MPFVYFSLVSCKKSHFYTFSIPFFSVWIDCLANSCDAKNPTYASVCRIFFAGMLIFLHSLVLFHRFCGDGSRGLCAVSRLRIGSSRADRAPSLTARHA